MASKKLHWYVLVFTESGPVYVTSVCGRTAYWNKDEWPHEFDSVDYAQDVVLGLAWNGYSSVVVRSVFAPVSHPYNYSVCECVIRDIKSKKEADNG